MFEVIIIGSGFAGQCAAAHLQRLGIENYRILERRDFMGGTWCQNAYPGAAVDVQSPLYSFSFAPYVWTQMFAEQKELEGYTNYVIERFKLREKTELNADVSELRWLANEQCWQVSTRKGQDFKARFVINASGPLSQAVIPEFNGQQSFQGEQFHTNAWRHDVDLKDKKVAIIGSGASAAQVIPAIIDRVKSLHVFQRTPHWVIPRPDYKFNRFERWLLGFKPLYHLLRKAIYWALELRIVGFKYSDWMRKVIAENKAKKFLQTAIKDPELRQKLTPDFTIGCKRVIISSTLYPALSQPHCHVHGKEDGIAGITPTGIKTTTGQHIDADVIVYATGYATTDGLIPYPVIGENEQTLEATWAEYPRAYLGTMVPNFPNLFLMTGPNTGIGHTSAIFIIEAQMEYIDRCLKAVREKQAQTIAVTTEAEAEYTDHIHQEMLKTVWHKGGCNSWYKSKSGKVIAIYPGFSFIYRWLAKRFKPAHHLFNGVRHER
ncbi:flavin-containing monooxygenase [Pseudidiomarina taiwanensis]|uniref:NAD(P)/FAD-dependent oxidoreductase n=1 Tax=Pseudidiomarina taiwanensis TaxID=337250 RepID=A0A432ZFJ3_9GAMM|nr:NAD(P)/FAD-dependent oxidoreductase [Pseudidiomarina taiwanensis]RUO76736.1 NAD(P)/FAD-dependent oxidoreductase [Pseudidiomarina taiwanensis]